MAEIKGIALGAMDMTEVEFDYMTLPVFFLKLHFFYKNKFENQQFVGNVIRLAAFQLINIQLKDKIKEPCGLWRYPWDEEKFDIEQTPESVNRIANLLDNLKHG